MNEDDAPSPEEPGQRGADPDITEAEFDAYRLRAEGTVLGHPAGLWVLFITEMWERFSYYGMRALLVLYLITETTAEGRPGPGFGWPEESAFDLYGLYTASVYLTPIAGGLLADWLLGTHRSMLIGGWIIAAGHICLAGTELFGINAGEAVTLQTSPGAYLTFMTGLVLIVIGTGFFKPCVSVMVGQLYGRDDPRRDSGFTIFYMGINVGAFLSGVVAGTLGETVGWHWGFGSAAVGMIAGLIVYQIFRPRYLRGVGLPPHHAPEHEEGQEPTPEEVKKARQDEWEATRPLTRVDLHRVGVILFLAFFGNIFFWTAFEQAGSSMNVFALESTDRTVGSWEFPATWYQSINPAAIVLFAPFFSWLWIWLSRRSLNPSTPMKFALGLYLLGLAFGAMVLGAMEATGDGLAGSHWLLITYVVYTWGELCLSPVGLSMVTKLAPRRLTSFMMGVWFVSLSLSNWLAGKVAIVSSRLESGEWTFIVPGLPGFFLMLVLFPIAAGLFMTLMTPVLKRMMHGIH